MRIIILGIVFMGLLSGSAHAKKVTRFSASLGLVTHQANAAHVAKGNAGAFETFVNLDRIFRDSSGVTVATLEGRRVSGTGVAVREETTILVLCGRGALSLDHTDLYGVSGTKTGTIAMGYDLFVPAPDTMMSAALAIVCSTN